MNFKKLGLLLVCLAAVAFAFSCKKEETTYESFSGSLSILGSKSIINVGEKLTFTPTGLTIPEGVEVAYSWKVTNDVTDTSRFDDGHYVYRFDADTCMTYTVTCTASASGYYSTSGYAYVTTVKYGKGGSIPEVFEVETDGTVTDADGIVYGYAKIGDLNWTISNIGTSNGGLAYKGYDIMSSIFGRYYNYEEAKAACPEGWSLPTDAQWMSAAQTVAEETLVEHETWKGVAGAMMIDATFNGNTLWEYWPDVQITNSTRLSALSLGYANIEAESFDSFYDFAAFWTADEASEDKAYARYIYVDKGDMYCFEADKKSFGANVRCVKAAE